MIRFISGLVTFVGTFFCSRYHLSLQILALRQQLGVLRRKNPRPKLRIGDRLFWILLSRLRPAWKNSLIIVFRFSSLPVRDSRSRCKVRSRNRRTAEGQYQLKAANRPCNFNRPPGAHDGLPAYEVLKNMLG